MAHRTLYVNNETGSDLNDGLSPANAGAAPGSGPFASLQKAFSSVSTSDCVSVANTGKPYPGGNWVSTAGGTAERPLVIDGHGAVISGLKSVPAEKWEKIREGIYQTDFWPMSNLLKGYQKINHWIGLPQIWWLDGKPGLNCKSEDELAQTPGGFFWNKAVKKLWFHAPGKAGIGALDIKIPVHATAIDVTCDFVVVKNFRSMFSWNDGFDVHGSAKNVVFKNCIATDNCGQGFSCHGTSSVLYEDCLAERCASSGSCDVNDCISVYRRCVFANNTFEAGVYAAERSGHIYESCLITGNEPFEQIWQKGFSAMRFVNCLITGSAGNTNGAVLLEQGTVYFIQCTFVNLPFVFQAGPEGSFTARNSIFSGCGDFILSAPGSAFAANRISSDYNVYWNSPGIKLNDKLFNATNFNEFISMTKNDAHSQWLNPSLGGFLDAEKSASSPVQHITDSSGKSVMIGAQLPQSVRDLYLENRGRYPLPDGSFQTSPYFGKER